MSAKCPSDITNSVLHKDLRRAKDVQAWHEAVTSMNLVSYATLECWHAASLGTNECKVSLSFALRGHALFPKFPDEFVRADMNDPVMRGWYFSSVGDDCILDVPDVQFVNISCWVNAVGPILRAQMRNYGLYAELEESQFFYLGAKDTLCLSWEEASGTSLVDDLQKTTKVGRRMQDLNAWHLALERWIYEFWHSQSV